MDRLREKVKTYFDSEMLTTGQVAQIVAPLILEQLFFAVVALLGSWMISIEGEAAVSAVSMMNLSNTMFNNICMAMATGGTVIIAQYIGAKKPELAAKTMQQAILGAVGVATVLAAALLILLRPVVAFFLSGAPGEVVGYAEIYFFGMCASLPFFCCFQSYAGCLRGWGRTRIAMRLTIMVSAIELVLSAALVRGFRLGVPGMVASMMLSRFIGMAVSVAQIRRMFRDMHISLRGFLKPDIGILRRIALIALPVALENALFSLGKTLSQRFVASYGITQLAALAVYNNISGLYNAPTNAMTMATLTIIGMCLGQQKTGLARDYARRLLSATRMMILALNVLFIPLTMLIAHAYGLSAEARYLAYAALAVIFCGQPIFWGRSFLLANALRAGGDAVYTSVVSLCTMWGIRVLLSFIFIRVFPLGIIGVVLSMVLEWIVRGGLFGRRMKTEKWYAHNLIE